MNVCAKVQECPGDKSYVTVCNQYMRFYSAELPLQDRLQLHFRHRASQNMEQFKKKLKTDTRAVQQQYKDMRLLVGVLVCLPSVKAHLFIYLKRVIF
jgi:hypothetical protein